MKVERRGRLTAPKQCDRMECEQTMCMVNKGRELNRSSRVESGGGGGSARARGVNAVGLDRERDAAPAASQLLLTDLCCIVYLDEPVV